jgi:hypothetical protein
MRVQPESWDPINWPSHAQLSAHTPSSDFLATQVIQYPVRGYRRVTFVLEKTLSKLGL